MIWCMIWPIWLYRMNVVVCRSTVRWSQSWVLYPEKCVI
uniref:Uncharacterized protein MANES_04G135600 n=1 Tax=Rhizophora mucronata TaxID=61149 RepID=A0A2P2KWS6_RHIMU